MLALAIVNNDTIHFATGDLGTRTLCGRPTSAPDWEALQPHEVEDALAGCLCKACRRTKVWLADD